VGWIRGVPLGEIRIGTRRLGGPGSGSWIPARWVVGWRSSVLMDEHAWWWPVGESDRLPRDKERADLSVRRSSVPLRVPSDSGSSENGALWAWVAGRHAASCSNANRPFSSSTSRHASEQYRLPFGPYTPPRLVYRGCVAG